jgi:hypothetical protein
MLFTWDGISYKLEAIIWSGLIGALVALMGTLLANWNSRCQLRMQHMHDAKQAELERAMSLRREVYMEAANWLTYMRQSFARYPDVSIKHPSPQTGYPGVPIKMQIVGGDAVRTLVQRILIEVSTFLEKHEEERRALNAGDTAISTLRDEIGKADEEGVDADEYNALVDKYEALRLDLEPRIEKFQRGVLADVESHSATVAELETSMANELGFEVDFAARAVAASAHTRDAFAVVERMINRAKVRRDGGEPPQHSG